MRFFLYVSYIKNSIFVIIIIILNQAWACLQV